MAQRRFLIASSLARLIRTEGGLVGRIVEGYFPARPGRDHFVSLEPGHSYLVLAPAKDGAGEEERTEVPRSQAEALLAVCAGKVGFECTIVRLPGGTQALLQRFVAARVSGSSQRRVRGGRGRGWVRAAGLVW